MRKFIGMVAVVCLGVIATLAQDYPKVEVFGGYQYSHLDLLGITSLNNNGWNASVTGNVNKWFGVAGDVSGRLRDRERRKHPDLHLYRRSGLLLSPQRKTDALRACSVWRFPHLGSRVESLDFNQRLCHAVRRGR
jgi:hypothetical protein